MKIRYKRIKVEIPDLKRGNVCQLCGKETKKPQFHHFEYAYPTNIVKSNPNLALKNTILLCFHCHIIANSLRIVEENQKKVELLQKIRKDLNTQQKQN